MTSTTPKGRRGMDYGQHAGTNVHLHVTDEPLTPREQATLDALIQIDKKFGKKKVEKASGSPHEYVQKPVNSRKWPINAPREPSKEFLDPYVAPPAPKLDYEILQEQLIEVGDQFSDEFKRGIEAAVAVLLERKHLEEFLS